MVSNKPLNSLSTEELLNVLNKTETKQEVIFTNDTERFLVQCNITPGNFLLKIDILYKIYYKWSSNPVERQTFYNTVKEFIPTELHRHITYCKINQPPFNMKAKSIDYLDREGKKVQKTILKLSRQKKHIDDFLNHYAIEPGNFYVENFILYYLYDKWTYSTKYKSPLSLLPLTQYINGYFNKKTKNKGEKAIWFGVNKSILKHITFEEMDQIREGRKRFPRDSKKTKRKEENQEKQNQVSESLPKSEH